MNLRGVDDGDIVKVSKGGRLFHAVVDRVETRVVHFVPIERGISYRHAGAREIVGHWRRAGRRRRPSMDDPRDVEVERTPVEVAKGQLSLAGRLERVDV